MDYNKEFFLLHLMEQVYSSLISVSNRLQTTGDRYNTPLTSRQYMTVLAILHLPEDETTIVNIANKLGATKQNITQLINSLKKKGFITIIPSPKDKRAVNVHLTELGIQTLVSCGGSVTIDFMADIFKDFKQEELEILWKLLVKKLCSINYCYSIAVDGSVIKTLLANGLFNDDYSFGLIHLYQ